MKKIKLFGIVGKVLSINGMCISSIILIIYLLSLLMGKPSSSTPSNLQPMPPITWSTPDTFTYDGNSHTINVSGYPTGSIVTYTGGENGTNGATSVGSYTIKAVITVDGYIPWDGTHALTINQATFGTFTIDDTTIPTNLITGYSATNWTQTASTSPAADSIDYTVTNVASGLSGKLSVNTSGSSTTGVKLDLATGVVAGTYEYTVHGVAHKSGYTDSTVDKVCYLTIYPTPSYLKLQDGTTYTINTSYNDFTTTRTNSGTFDFQDNNGVDQTITRSNITEIHLTDLQQITITPDNYLQYMCYGMTNLTVADILIPNTITSVGNNFCAIMFYGCANLSSLPSGFNLPQRITTVGNAFCNSMFRQSPLQSLPSGFNLPQGITTVGENFCSFMFRDSSLTSLPSNFNLPQNITSIGGMFCRGMFQGCTSLPSLPSGFNLPQGITSVGDSFCHNMFYNCASLPSLPSGFNLPTGITTVGDSFCTSMFGLCSSLISLPQGFNIPQGITSVGDSFCSTMFYSCSSLKNDNAPANLVTIHIPNFTASSYCMDMFLNAGTTNPTSPSPNTNVTVNAN